MLTEKELDKVVGGAGTVNTNNTSKGDAANVNNGNKNQTQINSGIINGGQNDASVHVENTRDSVINGGKNLNIGSGSTVTINL